MLLLQTSLFLWGLFAAFRTRFSPRAAAWIATAVFLFPPILTPMAAVWKDAQMAAFSTIAGTACCRAATHRGARASLRIALLFFAAAVRDNAIAAVPPLCVLIVASWQLRRKLVVRAASRARW